MECEANFFEQAFWQNEYQHCLHAANNQQPKAIEKLKELRVSFERVFGVDYLFFEKSLYDDFDEEDDFDEL